MTTAQGMLTSQLADALAFAIDAHGPQTRKGTDVPYAAHLLAVTALVLEMGGTQDEAIAAVLHDAVEDGRFADVREQITTRFGAPVLELVEAVSEERGEWEHRKRAYLEHLADCSLGALRVALADKLHNARSTLRVPVGGRWERFNRGLDQQRWWYHALADAFEVSAARDVGMAPFVAELRDVVDELFAQPTGGQ